MSNGDGRRDFVKKAVAGLAVLGGSAIVGCDGTEGTDAPANATIGLNEANEANLFRYVLARTNLPIDKWDSTLAAATLARNLFIDPGIARSFADDPQGYWNRLGLGSVTLNLDSIEVRLAVAFGDPEGRSLVAAKDYAGYIGYLERKGLLDLGQIERVPGVRRDALPNRCIAYGDCDEEFAYAVAVLLVVVAATYVTVAYTAAAVVMVETAAGLHSTIAVSTTTAGALRYSRAPALSLLSAVGGEEASAAYVEQTVERIAGQLESSDTYIRRGGPVGVELRGLIRNKLLLALTLPN